MGAMFFDSETDFLARIVDFMSNHPGPFCVAVMDGKVLSGTAGPFSYEEANKFIMCVKAGEFGEGLTPLLSILETADQFRENFPWKEKM
jgi:hypothetical protein